MGYVLVRYVSKKGTSKGINSNAFQTILDDKDFFLERLAHRSIVLCYLDLSLICTLHPFHNRRNEVTDEKIHPSLS